MNSINGNGLYDERLNQAKLQDLQREIEYLHLLKEAEVDHVSLLARIGKYLWQSLHALGLRRKAREAFDKGMYQPTHKKSSI
jgi:hypothetical protein